MNYRHAFHAGNFADVMKHALMARILLHLNAKPAPWRCLDIHAGAGLYDLGSDEAGRTGEWRGGVGLMEEPLAGEAEALLAPWRQALAGVRARHGALAYPGSPLLALALARGGDVVLANERHGETAQLLRAAIGKDGRARILELDGAVALRANIPPPEKRGLILLDPPFERADEFAALAKATIAAHAKWPTGIHAIWYPVKDAALVEAFLARLEQAGIARMLRLELTIHRKSAGLGGSGLLILNPPWRLAAEAEILLPALAARLALGVENQHRRAGWRCDAIRPDG
jgi:23S rRNA (adenine2030-N6)-methyltransferase